MSGSSLNAFWLYRDGLLSCAGQLWPSSPLSRHDWDTQMSHLSILIVEDESIVALDLQLQLENLGYKVPTVVPTGEQAVEAAGRFKPNLILMDIRLRGAMDGIEAASAIRKQADVPVVFLTSHSDDDTVRRAARTAPYGYLTKPFQIRELRAAIEVALTKASLERQLREADRWFAHTLRCIDDGVVVTDLQGRVRFLNPAAEALTGWSSEGAVGVEVNNVVCVDAASPTAASAHELVASTLKLGRPSERELAVRHTARDGQGVTVDRSVGPVFDDHGDRLGAVLVLRDATDRLSREARLRASEERFRGAFDHAPLGMALVSLAGEWLQVNAAICQLLGFAPAQLLGENISRVSSEADAENERRWLNQLLCGKQLVVQFERSFLMRDSTEELPTLVSVSILSENDKPTCYLYQVHDLREQKRAAAQMAELAEERMRREASEFVAKANSDMLSRASHEMRTPLNAVIGFAQLLEIGHEAKDESTRTYAQHIRTAGEHLLVLVNDLLDINRSAQGVLRLNIDAQVVSEIVDEALEMLRASAMAQDIALSAKVDSRLLVFADRMRLRQVLLNLLSNAIKYNRSGGSVEISSQSLHDQGEVILAISDSGIGMTEAQMARLYQPFDRLGQENTRIPGIGLGLLISRSLMRDMAGGMAIKSEPRVGTTVTLTLPAAA